MTDTPTLAGLASELADVIARLNRLESMNAHPEWCVPLEAEEEGDGSHPHDLDRIRRALTEKVSDASRQNAPDRASTAPQSDEQPRPVAGDSHEASAAEGRTALTKEPPVGTQVVGKDGYMWRHSYPGGWELWLEHRNAWDYPAEWSLLQEVAPLRLATNADRERVGLPRDQWPSSEPAPRILGPDEIAVKVPKALAYVTPEDVRDEARTVVDFPYWVGQLLQAIADALEAQEGR